jgi:hypothetical protein
MQYLIGILISIVINEIEAARRKGKGAAKEFYKQRMFFLLNKRLHIEKIISLSVWHLRNLRNMYIYIYIYICMVQLRFGKLN